MAQETKENSNKEATARVLIPEGRYVEAVGRRKEAVARVRVRETKGGKKSFIVNEKESNDYFPTEFMRERVKNALSATKTQNKFSIDAHVHGGGSSAQADAVEQGLARAIASLDSEWKKKLKKAGLLKHDTRIVERKKFGKKKARKAPQWSKR